MIDCSSQSQLFLICTYMLLQPCDFNLWYFKLCKFDPADFSDLNKKDPCLGCKENQHFTPVIS